MAHTCLGEVNWTFLMTRKQTFYFGLLFNSTDLRCWCAYSLQPAVTSDRMHHSRYLVYAAALLRN